MVYLSARSRNVGSPVQQTRVNPVEFAAAEPKWSAANVHDRAFYLLSRQAKVRAPIIAGRDAALVLEANEHNLDAAAVSIAACEGTVTRRSFLRNLDERPKLGSRIWISKVLSD